MRASKVGQKEAYLDPVADRARFRAFELPLDRS